MKVKIDKVMTPNVKIPLAKKNHGGLKVKKRKKAKKSKKTPIFEKTRLIPLFESHNDRVWY